MEIFSGSAAPAPPIPPRLRVRSIYTVGTVPTISYNPSWEGWREKEHTEINELKDQIDALESDGTWELRKKLANQYELVHTHEDRYMPISLAIVKPLSRSYFKMIEILFITRFFTRYAKVRSFRTAHVCEGPGGFIQAFTERCEQERVKVDLSLAMSLRPVHVQIPGWTRAIPFLKKNQQVRILYGADNTGDIYNLDNQVEFAATCGPQKVHLFTADGGFDFKMDYVRQEQSVFRLVVSSFAMGFQTLAVGGMIVIKVFDTFANPTIELLAFVSGYFKEWTLYKPAMSRPCNSERYYIGIGFKGVTQDTLDLFTALQKDLSTRDISNLESLFSVHLPMVERVAEFQQEIEAIQVQTIKKALTLDIKEYAPFWRESYIRSEEWCKYFTVKWRKIVVQTPEV